MGRKKVFIYKTADVCIDAEYLEDLLNMGWELLAIKERIGQYDHYIFVREESKYKPMQND